MKNLSRLLLPALLLVIALTLVGAPSMAGDGRINQENWINGWGAVVMYCHGANDRPAGSFANGWLVGLNETGQEIIRVDEATITAGHLEADQTGGAVLIYDDGTYMLYAEPNGYFSLFSIPDEEGKSFLSRWKGCDPVSYPGSVPPPAPEETVEVCIGGEFDQGDNCICSESVPSRATLLVSPAAVVAVQCQDFCDAYPNACNG
jgi:hypothetical protein